MFVLALNGHPKSARSGTSESQPGLLIAVELGLDAAQGLVLAKTMRNREEAPTNLLTDVPYRGDAKRPLGLSFCLEF